MRLSELLSKSPSNEYIQVEGFLDNKSLGTGKQRKLYIGKTLLNFYCLKCNDTRTFTSSEETYCLGVDENKISIDMNLHCGCGNCVQAWYLVESPGQIAAFAPLVRIIKKSIKLSSFALVNSDKYGDVSEYLDKADRLYLEGYGAASILYLRMIFEKIVQMLADYQKIDRVNPKGKKISFRDILIQVDNVTKVIPKEFSLNGYRLFSELSEIVHGQLTEIDSLDKFQPLRRLVVGILDNIHNSNEISDAIKRLNWHLANEVSSNE